MLSISAHCRHNIASLLICSIKKTVFKTSSIYENSETPNFFSLYTWMQIGEAKKIIFFNKNGHFDSVYLSTRSSKLTTVSQNHAENAEITLERVHLAKNSV